MSAARLGIAVLLLLGPGCGDFFGPPGAVTVTDSSASSGAGNGNDQPTIVGTVNPSTQCARAGASTLALQASLVGCPASGPCTVQSPPLVFPGTSVICPDSDTMTELAVTVDKVGKYQVESVLTFDNGTAAYECFVPDGGSKVTITETALMDKPTYVVSGTGAPCP